jgi:hypothetical protein
MKKEKLKNIFEYIEKDTDQSITDHIDMEDILKMSSYDELYDELDEQGFFLVDIIYFGKAIEYLQEYDPSLQHSLELASEMGYSPDALNSEILASILAGDKVLQSFCSFSDELEEILRNNK